MFVLPNLLGVEEDKKPKPNYYKHVFSDQLQLQLPRLSLTKSKSSNINPNFIEFEDFGPTMEEESAIKVVRSVVSGFLLERLKKRQLFTPINTAMIMDHLKNDGLLAPFEKQALLEVGLEVVDDDDVEEHEILISALNYALLSIESDTNAVNCLLMDNLNDIYRDTIYVLSIQPNLLVNELLLPFAFRVGNLALSTVELFPSNKQLNLQRLKVLRDENY